MPASDFNQKVWQALELIPRSQVTTYKDIARFIGRPRAARAVGNACHKNPNAPKVACHRVIRSDHAPGGYAGGVKKKIKLLKREGVRFRQGTVENFKRIIYKFK